MDGRRLFGSRLFGPRARTGSINSGAVALVISAILGGAATANAQNDAVLEEAVQAYRAGDVDAARAKFEEVLAQNPSSSEALSLYQKASEEVWLRMLTDRDGAIQAIAQRFSDLAKQGRKAKTSDEGQIQALCDAVISGDYGERRDAIMSLRADHGSYAVKGLWRALGDDDSSRRVHAILALNELGSDAVMPMVAVLSSEDSRTRQNAAAVLGAIGDSRALGALANALQDSDSGVRDQAQAALDSINGYEGQTAAALWTEMAGELLVGDARSFGPFDGVYAIWSMKDGSLEAEEVDSGLYALKLAEQACFQAISADASHGDAVRYLAITNASLAMEMTAAGNEEGASSARVALASCGEEALRDSLTYLVESGAKPSAAAMLAEELGLMRTSNFEALEMALGSSDKSTRYAAAFSLLNCGSQSAEVVRTVGEAASEQALRQALVIDSDSRNAEAIAAILNGEGYNVIFATNGAQGFARAKSFPPKDLVIASTSLEGVTVDAIIRGLGDDDRTSSTPIILMAPTADQSRYDDLYGSTVAAVLESPTDAATLIAAAEGAVGDLDSARQMALDLSTKAASLLATLDASQLSSAGSFLADVVSDSSRPAAVRIPALHAMGKMQNTSVIGPVAAVFGDDSASPEIRVAAADCLAGIFSNASLQDSPGDSVVDSLMGALEGSESTVKEAAARALGAARFLSSDQRATLLKMQRSE